MEAPRPSTRCIAVLLPVTLIWKAEHFMTELRTVLGSSQIAPNGVPAMASDPIKILIVDDDERVLIELERLLEGEGYSTATAWSGREALALSEKARFDLLLLDEHVGDLEFEALRRGLALRQPDAL